MKTLLTGSSVYGFPTLNSDVDMVAFVDEHDMCILQSGSDSDSFLGEGSDSEGTQGESLRFGNLNIIATTDEYYFETWRICTEVAIEIGRRRKARLNREQSVDIFKRVRKIRKRQKKTV